MHVLGNTARPQHTPTWSSNNKNIIQSSSCSWESHAQGTSTTSKRKKSPSSQKWSHWSFHFSVFVLQQQPQSSQFSFRFQFKLTAEFSTSSTPQRGGRVFSFIRYRAPSTFCKQVASFFFRTNISDCFACFVYYILYLPGGRSFWCECACAAFPLHFPMCQHFPMHSCVLVKKMSLSYNSSWLLYIIIVVVAILIRAPYQERVRIVSSRAAVLATPREGLVERASACCVF